MTIKGFVILTVIATALLCGDRPLRAQRVSEQAESKEDRAARLEDARQVIEARLRQRRLKGLTVTASDEKRVRRIIITVAPLNKNSRDDASTALSMAWQPALQRVTAFDEISVRVGAKYSVTCGRRAFQDASISLWGEGLTRTCRESK